MKHTYSKIVFMALMAFGMKATAQCTSCTTTITGTDNANHIIASGTTLCVSPTGMLTGLITILPGGMLCNQGAVYSGKIWVSGGELANYGTIHTHNVLTSNGGVFSNNFGATAIIDSLLTTGRGSLFHNLGTYTATRLAIVDSAEGANSGTLTCDFFGDSLGAFINLRQLIVNYDFYNGYNSQFTNNNTSGYLRINRDFYNSAGSRMQTGSCMISVGGNWYNSAAIDGPYISDGVSCGGFNISGGSYNSGVVGNASETLDLCDAGHPVPGIDGNTGTIASTVTFCTCSNNCVATGITEAIMQSDVLIKNVYPNPAVTDVTIELGSKDSETVLLEVYDMMGRKLTGTSVRTNSGENKLNVDVTKFAAGMAVKTKSTERHTPKKPEKPQF